VGPFIGREESFFYKLLDGYLWYPEGYLLVISCSNTKLQTVKKERYISEQSSDLQTN
jgi:hypothetical protein